MKAVVENEHGGPDVLEITDEPQPQPQRGQVLLKVMAAGINRADAMQRRNMYPVPAGESAIYGLEVAGEIVEVGEDIDSSLVGQSRVALLGSGGYAEFVAVNAEHTLPVPKNVSIEEAAGLIEVAATVYSNLVLAAGLSTELAQNQGKTALVHGGTGGIGMHATQLLKYLGVKVFATAGEPEKCAYLQGQGVEAINYKKQNFREVIADETEDGVDYILDVVGGKYLADNLSSLAKDGHLCIIALQGGAKAEANLGLMMSRRLNIHGTTLRGRPAQQKAEIVKGVGEVVWPLIEKGYISPGLDRSFPFEQVQEAHEYFDSGNHRGKIVLTMS